MMSRVSSAQSCAADSGVPAKMEPPGQSPSCACARETSTAAASRASANDFRLRRLPVVMRILSRYLLKQHLVPFVFALSALTAFQLLNQVARRLGDLVGKGLPGTVILEVFALSIPFIVTTTLSMAVLMAVLYAINRLAADRELVAIRAGGISLGRLMVPLVLAATGVAVVGFLFSDQVLPRSNHRLRTLLTDISRTKPTFSLKEQVINEVQRNRFFLRAARINQATHSLRDVTIYDLADQERKRIIYADSGYMGLSANQEVLYLTLYDGTMHELSRTDAKTFQQVEFRRNVIRVQGVGNLFTRTEEDNYKGDREMGVCEMENIIRGARREATLADRRAQIARYNGVRALVGLAPVPADTAVPLAALSPYCQALRSFVGPTEHLPHPSFIFTRQQDRGYSLKGDGSDHNWQWNGQVATEAYVVLPQIVAAAPDLAKGILRNWLAVPLVAGNKTIGMYSLDKASPGFFNPEHQRLAENLAAQAAIALESAHLLELLSHGKREWELTVDGIPQAICILDGRGTVRFCTPSRPLAAYTDALAARNWVDFDDLVGRSSASLQIGAQGSNRAQAFGQRRRRQRAEARHEDLRCERSRQGAKKSNRSSREADSECNQPAELDRARGDRHQ